MSRFNRSAVGRHFAKLLLVFASSLMSAQQAAPNIYGVLDGHMTPDTEVNLFEHSELLYPAKTVARGASAQLLPRAGAPALWALRFESNGRSHDLFDYLAENRVSGLLILKNGQVVLEDYQLGLTPAARWASWSMAKSISSTLIGAAVLQGLIRSLDDPVSQYVLALRGSAYDTVSIRDVLRMASGVGWSETYNDPASDCRRLTDAQLTHRPGASMQYMATLKRVKPPGTVWNYNSGEANILGAILEGATGVPLATYLSQTLWAPLGMESDATWWTESPGGMGLSGVGLGATLRDYGRFGLFAQNDGVINGRRVVPDGWFREAGSPQQIGGALVNYGYQWWPVPAGDPLEKGAFQALGIFGQHLYINPQEKLVIVVLSAQAKAVGAQSIRDLDLFNAVAERLH